MAFDLGAVRLERFNVELHYSAAFNFMSLKGALAERWAHGPIFGAYAEEGGVQVTLTPEAGTEAAERKIHGIYGVRLAAFNEEQVVDKTAAYEVANEWFRDVVEVLRPKLCVKIIAQWFALYPVSNAAAAASASKRLRTHYYRDRGLDGLMPQGYQHQHYAVDSLCVQGDRHWSLIFGAVGPVHRGTFFLHPDPERDQRWWMGLRVGLNRENTEGIQDPLAAVSELIEEGGQEYERLVPRAYGSIF